MADEFDSTGTHLETTLPTTVYQAPPLTSGDRAIVISCLAAYVGEDERPTSLQLQATDPTGAPARVLARRDFIGPGMAVEMFPARVILSPGERLQGIASMPGALDLTVSVLASAPPSNQRGIPPIEVFVGFLPPDAVGSNANEVNIPTPIGIVVDFPPPSLLLGVALEVPSIEVAVSLPEVSGPVVPYEANVPSIPVLVEFAAPSSVPDLLPPWTVSQLTTAMWLNAGDASTFTLSDGAVSEWRDKSGNGRHVGQTVSVRRPLYLETALDDLAGVRFRGEKITSTDNDRLLWSQRAFLENTDLTIMAVVAHYSEEFNKIQSILGGNSAYSISISRYNDSLDFNIANYGGFLSGSAPLTVPPIKREIIIGTLSGVNGRKLYFNGTQIATTADTTQYGAGLTSDHYLGASGGIWQYPLDGIISEFIVMTSEASTDVRQRLEGNAAYEWNFRPQLPNNHPYRYVRPVVGA